MIVRELVTLLRFQSQGIQEAQAGMATLQNAARALVATLAGMGVAFSIKGLAEAGDQMLGDINKLQSALKDRGEATRIYDAIYESAKDTGVAVTETASSFGRYWIAMEKVGKSADQTVDMVSGLQVAMANAGVSTSGMAAVTLQLGQALGKGKLNGDELTSLRENMPQLVEGIRKSLNLTDEAFQKLAESKEGLSAQKIIGPIMEFAAEAKRQMSSLPITMSRSLSIVRVVWSRLLADLDKNLGLSQHIARNLQGLSRWLEGLRSRLPAVGELVRELGGIETIFRVLTTGAYAAAAAFAVMNRALLGTILRFAAIGLAIAALVLGLDDLAVWMQGGDSLLGRQFGEFAPILDRIREALGPLTPLFEGVVTAVSGMVANTVREFRNIGEAAVAAAGFIQTHWGTISGLFAGIGRAISTAFASMTSGIETLKNALLGAPAAIRDAWNSLIAPVEERIERIRTAIREIGQALGRGFNNPNLPPPEPGTVPDGGVGASPMSYRPGIPPAFTSPIAFGQQFIPRMGAGGGFATANVNAPITNNVNVTATGVSGAEVAAAAQNGVGRAMRASSPGEDFARAIGVASPRVEAAAA